MQRGPAHWRERHAGILSLRVEFRRAIVMENDPILISEGVLRVEIAVMQGLRLDGRCGESFRQLNLEVHVRIEGAVNGEDAHRAVGAPDRNRIDFGDFPVLGCIACRRSQFGLEDCASLSEFGGNGEWVERGLAPSRSIRFGHDRSDHIDELRQACSMYPIDVLEQCD